MRHSTDAPAVTVTDWGRYWRMAMLLSFGSFRPARRLMVPVAPPAAAVVGVVVADDEDFLLSLPQATSAVMASTATPASAPDRAQLLPSLIVGASSCVGAS